MAISDISSIFSQASYPCHRVPRLRQSRRKEELAPPASDRPRLRRERVQATPTFTTRTSRHKERPSRGTQPRQTQEPRQGSVDREDRAAPGHRWNDALRLALRGSAVEAKGHGGGRRGRYLRRGAVPSVADDSAPGRVVPEYRHDGTVGSLLCHVHLPSDPLLYHRIRCAAGSLAVPELVRGRWIL